MAKRVTKRVQGGVKATRRRTSKKSVSTAASAFAAGVNPVVKAVFADTMDLPTFRETPPGVTRTEALLLVEQALVLIEQNYAHLPLKEAMHGVNPIQKLKLLQHRLLYSEEEELSNELEFHREMTRIFTSVRDLHTNYVLPAPFNQATAFVPFLIEEFKEGGRRRYLVTRLSDGFESPPFEPGVEVISWNGIPIARAVEINGDRFAGSNEDARRARGVATLTVRPLAVSLPPDEDWVTVEYRTGDGTLHELRTDWLVFTRPGTGDDLAPPRPRDATDAAAGAYGVDLELHETNRAKKFLFAPDVIDEVETEPVTAGAFDESPVEGGLADLVPESVMEGRSVVTPSGTFGYIRIRRFSMDLNLDGETQVQAMVEKFIELAEDLPQEGLIVDVRGNPGGIIWAGERLLQLMTPHPIEPERLQFVTTPVNLQLCSRNSFLEPWVDSIRESVRTGSAYSQGFPVTTPESANAIGQRYCGPVVVITDALCYSTTDFFAAGIKDHGIALILGVDGNTGAGGANVWRHDHFLDFFPPGVDGSPYKRLPKRSGMRVSIRRTLRVRKNAGIPLEDLGVVPDLRHDMTREDLLNSNVDLINQAGEILGEMPIHKLHVEIADVSGDQATIITDTLGMDRLDFFVDGRPEGSIDVDDGETEIEVPGGAGSVLELEGYSEDVLVAARKLTVQ
jgi:C-terminal processing protease CtpA/Prc